MNSDIQCFVTTLEQLGLNGKGIVEGVVRQVAEEMLKADLDDVTPVVAYEKGDEQACLKAQAHAFILGLLDE